MPPLHLPVAVSLAFSALASFGIFYSANRRSAEGKIRLPTHAERSDELLGHDPFDVAKREDLVDGYPIDEERFWAKTRRTKIILTFVLSIALALSTISLGWSIADERRYETLVFTLHVAFALYLVVMSGRSIGQDDAEAHSDSLIHITSLLAIAFILLGTVAVLPASPPPSGPVGATFVPQWQGSLKSATALYQAVPLAWTSFRTNFEDLEPFLRILWYIYLAIYTVAFALAVRTPLGPLLHYPPSDIYSEKTVQSITNTDSNNVCGLISGSCWDYILFSYTTKIVWLGNVATSLEIGDLPVVPANMRATFNYTAMRNASRTIKLRLFSWTPKPGSGWQLGWQLTRLNGVPMFAMASLAAVSACLFYTPAYFLKNFIQYLEVDPNRENQGWGWVYVIGLFMSNAVTYLVTGQLWSLSTTTLQVRFRIQMNSILYAKTLVRKDIASSSPPKDDTKGDDGSEKNEDEDDFSSKAQIMTLMTTDVDRVSDFAWHIFALVDSPIEIAIGTLFLYNLLGVSCFVGLAATCLFLPMNHFAGKVVVGAQERLMKARDERVALMNEILGAIRMLKFMAWERSFEKRVLAIREKELKAQKLNYTIETLWNAIWNGSPIIVTLITFWHYAVVRRQLLTPSVAFTSIMIFTEMKFALSGLPETFINMLQTFVSLRRIEKYLNGAEVAPVPPLSEQSRTVAFQSCTATWPQDRLSSSRASSAASTPRKKFVLMDLSLNFPQGELSLICGKLGSGKTLLLLALLGEADVLAGQILCPRSPPDSLATYAATIISKEDWIVDGACAYVPQAAWLRNASIKENILFNLPYDEERYLQTLEACALVNDLEILEDGDESEIGERGVNLSGGQKARVSLARAVYSRASILLLDDVLSAVDAHTAHHLFHQCLKGGLMAGRTLILVSHHVQLCAPGANYIVALDNGRVAFEGLQDAFFKSGIIRMLTQSNQNEDNDNDKAQKEIVDVVEERVLDTTSPASESSSTAAPSTPASVKLDRKPARKLVEEEKRAVGRISRDIWETYIWACGGVWYWPIFLVVFLIACATPVLENSWLRYWSNTVLDGQNDDPVFYISVYAALTTTGLILGTLRWFVLYRGSIHASHVLYERLLENVLFANIRFHDTVSRGRLLNRFGKDFEGVDSSLSDNFGRSFVYLLSATTTIVTVSVIGGLPFIIAVVFLGTIYWSVAKIYGQTSRDMRRLDSVTRSPLYSMYGETISGVTILRAFGASSKFLRDMLRCVDTNANPYYWMWGVNRWLSVRFNLLSSCIVGATGLACLISPSISASFAGFALAFASTITGDLLFMVRRFVGLEQSMVALERIKEYTEIKREAPEFIEPRPDPSWPSQGEIKCEDLVIRYAPDLPDVLHRLNFEIRPGEKVGILGRTGSGKSTLALSFFRFVEATSGSLQIDGVDISKIGLTDLRSRLTIIPQDPTILSGTVRSTLDVFDEYEDAEIYEALRRVHLIPSEDQLPEAADTINANIFRDLDSKVSEAGDNFSTGEKQLLCMARAILKRSKVLVMDEATASVDYATDELIGKTIRHEFAESTILTIAHRLRTVIDYDRVMLLDQGRIVEFDKPALLLDDPSSQFHSLCKATGKEEFLTLKKMAGL
ncbi:multidrug resistance-associated ABC transporter [Crepidotus variabilis]|uniref:Multidrug resistance-associated ABC transporter n=1 Tax=Crepidotus variabilis TaxID=179855 RepID=A0A9P6JT36_9AGAR|nr:multidrug resistance-associated ABC transporter [Crepidotus variabilis]